MTLFGGSNSNLFNLFFGQAPLAACPLRLRAAIFQFLRDTRSHIVGALVPCPLRALSCLIRFHCFHYGEGGVIPCEEACVIDAQMMYTQASLNTRMTAQR